MAIVRSTSLPHWNYFLALEDDLLHLSRYVDLTGNDDAYSVEIGRLLMLAAAEVDVVMKQLCHRWDPTRDVRSIGGYFAVMSERVPAFLPFAVRLPRFGLRLAPWSTWTAKTPPFWWTAHNKVKHERHTRFADGNLKNCVNSAAALYIAVLFLHSEEARDGSLAPPAQLFDVDSVHDLGQFMGRFIVPMVDVPIPPAQQSSTHAS